jgi:hypothetical protein
LWRVREAIVELLRAVAVTKARFEWSALISMAQCCSVAWKHHCGASCFKCPQLGHPAIDSASGAVLVEIRSCWQKAAWAGESVMRVLLAGLVSLLAGAAFAQSDNKPAIGTDLRIAQAEIRKTDNVPPGGCMPIGLTARGDLVFPMQCRELIERERGPVPDQQLPVPEQRSQQEPRSQQEAPVIATPVIAAPAEKEMATTGQTSERRKRVVSGAERRKPLPPLRPVSGPQITGAISN